MMKNLLFVYICLFGLALPLSAQKLDAQDILDRTATAFRQAGGIQADFTVQTYAKGALQGSSVGTIRLKGEKFLLDADGVIVLSAPPVRTSYTEYPLAGILAATNR